MSTRTRFPSEDSEEERIDGNDDSNIELSVVPDEDSVVMRRAAERGDWPALETFLSRRPWLDPCAAGCCFCADPPRDRSLPHPIFPLQPPPSPSRSSLLEKISECTECGWPKGHSSFASSLIVIAARCGNLEVVNGILNMSGLLGGALEVDDENEEEAKKPRTPTVPHSFLGSNSVRKRSRAEGDSTDGVTCSTGNCDICVCYGARDRCVTPILTAALYAAIGEANAAIVRVLARTLFRGSVLDCVRCAQRSEMTRSQPVELQHGIVASSLSSCEADSGCSFLPLLHAATLVGHVDTVRALVEGQALSARDVWETVASIDISLIFSPDGSYVLALLGGDGRVEKRASLMLTPMHIAAAKGRTELVRYFLDLRYRFEASRDQTGGAGRSRIHRGLGKTIGSDVTVLDQASMRVVSVLFSGLNGHADCVSLLCEHGADVPCVLRRAGVVSAEPNHQHEHDAIVISPELVREDVLVILEDHGG